MLFNSLTFAIFLPSVFALYWLLASRGTREQNLFLLAASYVFYGWWDWRFLSLLAVSSSVDYWIGSRLGQVEDERRRRVLLGASLTVNLGLLGFFKYFDFFSASFADLLGAFGMMADRVTLNVILPVGISFYTFQTLSYTIDIYRRRTDPIADPVAFFAFVSFFPQLVAGPIERAANLLPQFRKARRFDADLATDAVRQILWGLFKKVVVADGCAVYVNEIFGNAGTLEANVLLLGVVYFAFQIYGDFSGYSDIAIGTARLFGFDLMRNFAYPYFSRDIAEFWRRWHISLSTWFRDYLYIPLGGSRVPGGQAMRNILIVFLVSGFWHGANWTFLVWGLLHGLYFIPVFLRGRNRRHLDTVAKGSRFPSVAEFGQMAGTFLLTLIAWVFFRSPTLSAAVAYLTRMMSPDLLRWPVGFAGALPLVAIMVFWEWRQRERPHGLDVGHLSAGWRRFAYLFLATLIVWFGGTEQEFIYFQF